MSKSDEILRKLRLLLRHKESAAKIGNAAEAAAFAAKVQELLAVHKLSMTDVELAQEGEVNPFVKVPAYPTEYGERFRGYRVEWTEDLADIIARAHYCRLLIVENTNVFLFLGRKTDAEIASFLFYRIAAAALKLCETDREAAKKQAQRGGYTWIGSAKFRESFYFGFSREIYERLEEGRKKLMLAHAPLYAAGAESSPVATALVRADKEVEARLDVESGGKPATEFKDERTLALSAILQGRRRGREINLQANALTSEGEPETKLIADREEIE